MTTVFVEGGLKFLIKHLFSHLAPRAEVGMGDQLNPDNWPSYLAAFRQCFTELNSTHPSRFPRGESSLKANRLCHAMFILRPNSHIRQHHLPSIS